MLEIHTSFVVLGDLIPVLGSTPDKTQSDVVMTKSDGFDHNINLLKETVKLWKRLWIKHNKLSDSNYKSEKVT